MENKIEKIIDDINEAIIVEKESKIWLKEKINKYVKENNYSKVSHYIKLSYETDSMIKGLETALSIIKS